MLFKKNLIEMILLLVVIISFAWIGVYKQAVVSYNEDIIEGMDTNTKDGDDVPGCNDTIYSEYDPHSYDSKYILKTQVVPPVCPACPSVINKHGHDGLVDGSGASITQESTEINETTQVSNSSSVASTNVTNIENTTINPEKKQNDSSDAATILNNNIKSDELLKKQKSEYDRESFSENVSERCPPCPSCERCPEPAFTCEKVINYKSPSAKQYLPMPVLNDFSTFPSSS